MTCTGVIGLGDMGSGLAKNLIKNGFETIGIDLLETRMKAFVEMGGTAAQDIAAVAQKAQAVYVMVMSGAEAKNIILG